MAAGRTGGRFRAADTPGAFTGPNTAKKTPMLKSTSCSGGPSFLAGLAAIISSAALPAADLNITQAVTYNGQTATMRLTRQNLRGPNFELLKQESNGAYTPAAVTPERAYLGTVDEFPDAVASGILTEAGVFRGLIIFDRGNTWYTQGGSVHRTLGWTTADRFQYPTVETTPGQAGTSTRHLDLGFDVSSGAYTNLGGTMSKALEEVEYAAALQRGLYLPNLLVRPYLARVIVRTSGTHDPYLNLTTGQFLGAIGTEWQTNHSAAQRNLVAGMGANVSGLAWVGGFGASYGYSVQPWSPNGNTWGYLRHEMGHNFGMNHNVGGDPEGATIMSNNGTQGNIFARMSTSEVETGLNLRDAKASQMADEGTYIAVDLPPYGCMDAVGASPLSNVTIDVLANDHDANGDALTIQSFDATSELGGAVSLSAGTGPGGRDQLVLHNVAGAGQFDWFTYRVQDSSGQTATAVVGVRGEHPSTKLSGTIIGSTGSYGGNPAYTKDKAMDGNFSTFYAANSASGDWIGLDLGADQVVTKIKFAARAGFEYRMDGGVFQVSNSASFSSGVVTLHTISGSPASGALTTLVFDNNTAYRYVRYLGPDNGECNVAELEFWGGAPIALPVLLSQGKPVTASSYQSGNDPADGNDGNSGTRWSASGSSYPQWWRVDLGSVRPIKQAAIEWYNGASRAYKYKIEISNNGTNYTLLVDKTGNTVIGNFPDNFTATARYVRITSTGVAPSGGWASFWECKIYGN